MAHTIIHLSSLFNYYRVGRFVFALAMLISFQAVGLPYAKPMLIFILSIYSFISMIRLFIPPKNIYHFDFLLDIVFISAMVYISFDIYSYLTLLYLFPIFFSSVLIKTKRSFIFPVASILFYATTFYVSGNFLEKESILNISLHLLSFLLISLAGDNLKTRMEKQQKYIEQLEEERIQMQGYERLYRVSADLAHELRNPLASISAAAQFLKEGRNDKKFIDMLNTETERLTNLVNDFLLFSRPTDAPKEIVDIADMLKHLVNAQKHNKKVLLDIKDNAIIISNRLFMEIAISNIIKNALETAKSTVSVTLKCEQTIHRTKVDQPSHCDVTIEIEDDGVGISNDLRERIFEPFFTTKATGTGLGLAIAYRVIKSFNGDIKVDKSKLGGAKFTIIFREQKHRSVEGLKLHPKIDQF